MPPVDSLRVASLNFLWHPENLAARVRALHTALRALNPDIVCLQEIGAAVMDSVVPVMRELGYMHDSGVPHILDSGHEHGVVTFSRAPAQHQVLATLPEYPHSGALPAVVSAVEFALGRSLTVINTHLMWGSRAAGMRYQQLRHLARVADENQQVGAVGAVLLGDLNATPDSSALRYMRGLEGPVDGTGTLWVDAWQRCGADPALAMTNEPAVNPLAANTCLKHDLDPQLVPPRRIDYALTHEYNYGKAVSPIAFGRWLDAPVAGTWVSDHSGVWMDIRV